MDDLQINTPKGEGENNQGSMQPTVEGITPQPQIAAGPNLSAPAAPVMGSINLASEGATPVMEPTGQIASMPEKLEEKAAEIVPKQESAASPVEEVLSQMETVNPKSLYENANDTTAPAKTTPEETPKKKRMGKFKLIGGMAFAVLVLGAGFIFGTGLLFKEQAVVPSDITRFAAEENCALNQYAPESASQDDSVKTEGTTVKHEPCEPIAHDSLVAGSEQCALIDTLYENSDKYLLASETVINLKDWFDACHSPSEPAVTEEVTAVTEETLAVTQEETGITTETQAVTPKVPRKTKTVTTQETQAETMETAAITEETLPPTEEIVDPTEETSATSQEPEIVIEEPAEPVVPAADITPVQTPVITQEEVIQPALIPQEGQVPIPELPVPEIPEESISETEEAFLLNFAYAAEPEVTCNGPYESLSAEGKCDFDCDTFLDDLLKADSDPAYVANVGGISMTQRSLEDLLLQHEECVAEPSAAETEESEVAAAGPAETQQTEMAAIPADTEETNVAAVTESPAPEEQLAATMHSGAAEVEAVAATEQATDITKELYPTGPEVYVYLVGFLFAQAYIFRKKIYAHIVSEK